MTRKIGSCVVLWSWLLVCRLPAQVSTASVAGVVRDASGATVRAAQVTTTELNTGVSRTTNTEDDGTFSIPFLPVGPYTLSVQAPGFSVYRQTGLVLDVGEVASVSVVLKPGEISQSVTVSSDAAIVNTTATESSQLINQRQVEGLPLNGRNPANLVFLSGGVSNPIQNIPLSNTGSAILQNSLVYPTEVAPTVHGVRGGGVYFSLDGANNLDSYQVTGGPFPNPDATEEFSVVSGNYGSRYVSAPGGAVNIVTKSGTNAIHGDLFEFLRNGDVNARNFFSAQSDLLKRNQFGATLGMPILKDRWFVFGSYQGTRLSNVQGGLVSFVPTAAERTGDLSAITTPINNPAGGVFAGNQIPASLLDPTMQNLLKYIPLPTSANGSVSYAQPIQQQEDQYVVKSDYIWGNQRIFGRYFYDNFNWDPTGIPNGNILAVYRGQQHQWTNATFGDTWALGGLVSDFRFSFIRDSSITEAGENSVSLTSLGANIPAGQFPTIQQVGVTGLFSVVPGNYNGFPRNTYDFSEDINLVRGRHQLSFGAEVQHINATLRTDNQQNPVVTFSGAITGSPLADYLLGQPSSYAQSDGIFINAEGTLPGFYVEDKVRLTSRLTATVGVRWDPYWPFHSVGNRIECYRPGQQSTIFENAPIGLVFPGDKGCNASGTGNNLLNIQPRGGLAWQADSAGKTVVRAGYGLYTAQFPMASFLGFGQVQPFIRSFSLVSPGSITNPYATFPGGDPFTSGFQLNGNPRPSDSTFINPALAYSFIPNFQLAYTQQWSLAVERSLGQNDIVTLSYFGTKGTHLSMVQDSNSPIYIPGGSTQSNAQSRRPDPQIGRVNTEVDWGNSSYNGLDINYRHRFSRGFTVTSTFDFSKSIDDASSPANVLLTGGSYLPVPGNPSLKRGLSDFDQNHTWRTSGVWDLPFFANSGRFTKMLLGGWQLNGIFVMDSGLPFSATASYNELFTGNGNEYANTVPGVSTTLPGGRSEQALITEYFNIAAFTKNLPGTVGTAGRNILRSPGLTNLDSAAVKKFAFNERFSLVFRTEFFNVLNHTQFLPPGGGVGTAAFGKLTGARDPRILQFSMKLFF